MHVVPNDRKAVVGESENNVYLVMQYGFRVLLCVLAYNVPLSRAMLTRMRHKTALIPGIRSGSSLCLFILDSNARRPR